jgi:hypothetical protein
VIEARERPLPDHGHGVHLAWAVHRAHVSADDQAHRADTIHVTVIIDAAIAEPGRTARSA